MNQFKEWSKTWYLDSLCFVMNQVISSTKSFDRIRGWERRNVPALTSRRAAYAEEPIAGGQLGPVFTQTVTLFPSRIFLYVRLLVEYIFFCLIDSNDMWS